MKKYPDADRITELKITPTPEMLERGKYLSNTFGACLDCHSERNFGKFAAPLVPGTEGKGGFNFGEGAGFIPAKNITSDKETGLGNWTDAEIFTAITEGIDREGEPLAPMMPYLFYRYMDENDIKAIIAYIRTLPPIKNEVPEHKLNFPVNLIFRLLPKNPDFKKFPDTTNRIAVGEYYSANCMACHTPMDGSEFKKDKVYAGGVEFPLPGGIVRSANITPDKETGIGSWTKELFIQKFKSYLQPELQNVTVKEGEFNTIMPWTFLANATEADLGAIYDYLMTQKPVSNKVVKFSPVAKLPQQ